MWINTWFFNRFYFNFIGRRDLSDKIALTYNDNNGVTRSWKLELYGDKDHSQTVVNGKYVYIPTDKQNKLDCLRLVFGLLVYNKNIDGMFDAERIDPFENWLSESTDTKLRNHSLKITSAFRKVIDHLNKDDLTCRIIDVLNKYFGNSNKYDYLYEFCKIISNRGILQPYNTVSTYQDFLDKYSDVADLPDTYDFINDAAEVLSETLMFSFNIDNVTRDEKSSYRVVNFICNKSRDDCNYDPHREMSFIECQNELTQSTAVKFCLISEEKRDLKRVRDPYFPDGDGKY